MKLSSRGFSHRLCVLIYFLLPFAAPATGFGSMGPIAASFGEYSFFCSIDASGEQAVICWETVNRTSSASRALHYSTVLPPLAALSGGEGFMCGILANTSQALCWGSLGSSENYDLVPAVLRPDAYSHLAAGRDHVCAIRGSYYSEREFGIVDCWDVRIPKGSNDSLSFKQSNRFDDRNISNLAFKDLVSGDGFTCGSIRDVGVFCWGPNSANLGLSTLSGNFVALASGMDSLCGVSVTNGEVQCWGNPDSHGKPPSSVRFVDLAAGELHFCGIREDNHGIECWGNFTYSLIPKGSGFLSVASSNFVTCGIRESDLILDCWFTNTSSAADFDPPLELCSPGLCTAGPCKENMFAFNASLLNEPLTSLCVRKDLKICSFCGLNCSKGFFPSSPCNGDADRVCTPCSLCQNSSCWDSCGLHAPKKGHWNTSHSGQVLLKIGSSASGFLLILGAWYFFPRLMNLDIKRNKLFLPCISKSERGSNEIDTQNLAASLVNFPGAPQVFRLSELKDATNGFKEFNELGRGSYGFVYKALLTDGRQVAVRRANAATIIHSNIRDFEMELEILCNVRHKYIVNLLGYCAEMGERLLVYEFMPLGTLKDHLHGSLRTLNWNMRVRIAMQAAKGLEYLHKEVVPPIAHRNIRSSKILLDADWCARISGFGLLTPKDRDVNADMRMDVYGFGVVLLEILTGRKAYEEECDPPSIVDWALPYIKQGKGGDIIDRRVTSPKNVEPLLKLAEIAELALRQQHSNGTTTTTTMTTICMSDLAISLEHLVQDGLVF